MKCPRCGSSRTIRNGSGRGKCLDDAHKGGPRSFGLVAAEFAEAVLEARQGWAPDADMNRPVAAGFQVKGTSTLVDQRTGQSVLQWVKTTRDQEMQALAMDAIVAAMAEAIPREKPRRAPKLTLASLLNLYVITDFHLGMLSWGEETGADWDTDIAEELLVSWFREAIERSPRSRRAVLGQLGDFMHWDGLDAVTPASKHVLDADTRFPKLVRVAIRALRRVVGMLLERHDEVRVIVAEGNHDPASSVHLREMMAVLYEDEPRVTVDLSPDPYYCVEHGATALFFHHGHKRRMKDIDTVFAAKFREVFGRSHHAYAHMGHLHHDEVKESSLMRVEQHRTLAAPDAYASRGGWMSGRDAKVITYHDVLGEVERRTVSPGMVEASNADPERRGHPVTGKLAGGRAKG